MTIQQTFTNNLAPSVRNKSIPHPPSLQRVNGSAEITFKTDQSGTRTMLDRLFQRGSAKIRLPKSYGDVAEAVLINTAGGLTGGDRLDWIVSLAANTRAVITTQACERVYEAIDGAANISTNIKVAEGAELHWLPQETILYDRSALQRSLDVDLACDARFVALEAVMLGRKAMGERVQAADFRDRWRIRREGKLIFADDVVLSGAIEEIENCRALLNGNKAFATLFYSGQEDEDQLQVLVGRLRKIAPSKTIGISAFDRKILIRLLASDSYTLRQQLIPVLSTLRETELPKVWRT